jgi:16S rRNA (cytidine1402-2'-O)-methyltransferase
LNFEIKRLTPGLYFVATPIGTARDITLRALDVLASADVIAAEDTRSLRRLLEIHGVPLNGRQVLAYHDHSSAGARAKLISHLEDGKSVAYASEAGTPLIADPGYHLAKDAAEAGHLVTTAPGASAVVSALTLAGLPTDAFFFEGFLPSAKNARQTKLESLRDIPGTLVLYESPKRLAEMLKDAAKVLGGTRSAAVCREITKRFEEVKRGDLNTLAEEIAAAPVKGEIVVLIDRASAQELGQEDIEAAVLKALETMSVRDAAETVAKATGANKRKIYALALDLKSSQ